MTIVFNYDFRGDLLGVVCPSLEQERWFSILERQGKIKEAIGELHAERRVLVKKLEELDKLIAGLNEL